MRFDGRVVVITGAGRGLGRSYALAFASRGAKVVVNDLPPSKPGDSSACREVVRAIQAAGGVGAWVEANVTDGEAIVGRALEAFGRIDVLVNNAGIIRDSSFLKLKTEDWDAVFLTHVKGAYACSKAAWPHFQRQKFGRIINACSASGLYGNFGQANYAAAKAALVGFSKCLAIEGAKHGILVNCIAPLAGTDMTKSVLPQELHEALLPSKVAPVVLKLASENHTESGQVYEVAAGWVAAVRWQRSSGVYIHPKIEPEDVERQWQSVSDFSGNCAYPESLQDSVVAVSQRLLAPPAAGELPSSSEHQKPAEAAAALLAGTGACPKSMRIFALLEAFLRLNPIQARALHAKVNSCFCFKLHDTKDKTKHAEWTVDLKPNASECVRAGACASADATFELSDDAFAAVCLGQLNAQMAFLQGKMKIKGSLGKATKFTPQLFPKMNEQLLQCESTQQAIDLFLKQSETDQQQTLQRGQQPQQQQGQQQQQQQQRGELSAAARRLKCAPLYDRLCEHLSSPAGRRTAQKVKCVYRLNIRPDDGGGKDCSFILDLVSIPPAVYEVAADATPKCDCTISMQDDVFCRLACGALNPHMAFLRGKLKVSGNTKAAMKFTADMFPPAIAKL